MAGKNQNVDTVFADNLVAFGSSISVDTLLMNQYQQLNQYHKWHNNPKFRSFNAYTSTIISERTNDKYRIDMICESV